MKIMLFDEQESVELTDELKTAVQTTLDAVNMPVDTCVNIMFTHDEGIRQLNFEFRNINTPTDVLSFPAYDFEGFLADCISKIEPEIIEGCVFLGDIAISLERAKAQSEEYNHSLKRETAFLALHGLLHLIGYDHIEDADKEIMEAKQCETLNKVDIKRA